MTQTPGAMQIDAALVRQLAELLDETHLTEIEVEDGDRRIRVARKAAAVQVAAPGYAPAVAASAPPAQVSAPATNIARALKSPMVGTVYLSSEPGAKPFANVGDVVVEGQTLVIIEAMKVMNPITADVAGRIAAILVENGAPVEYDQPLIIIE